MQPKVQFLSDDFKEQKSTPASEAVAPHTVKNRLADCIAHSGAVWPTLDSKPLWNTPCHYFCSQFRDFIHGQLAWVVIRLRKETWKGAPNQGSFHVPFTKFGLLLKVISLFSFSFVLPENRQTKTLEFLRFNISFPTPTLTQPKSYLWRKTIAVQKWTQTSMQQNGLLTLPLLLDCPWTCPPWAF